MLQPKAYRDIDDIFSYIALEKQEPEIAERQTNRIWEALKSLRFLPQSHQDRLYGRYAKKGYKQLLIDSYIAIYKIDEKKKIVYIVTVQHQNRSL